MSPFFGNTNFMYLEIKSLITVEHQHKSSQLMTKSFHWFCLASTSRTCINNTVNFNSRARKDFCEDFFISTISLNTCNTKQTFRVLWQGHKNNLHKIAKLPIQLHKRNYIACSWRQGWHSGESTYLPPLWPGFKTHHLWPRWVEFVVGSHPCPKSVFSRFSVFLPHQKPTLPNSKFNPWGPP